MQVRKIQPEDRPVIEAFLHEHRPTSLFMLNNVRRAGLEYQHQPYQAEYVGVFRDNALIGVAAHTWLNTLLLQAPELEALALLEAGLPRFLTRPVQGVLGPREQCLELMDRLGLDPGAAILDRDEPVYSLDLGRLRDPPALAEPYQVRQTRAEELPGLARWRLDYLVEALNLPLTGKLERRAVAEVRRAHEEARAFVLQVGDELGAYCAFNAAIPDAVQIGGIWTPPALRRRGYGTTVTAGALEHAFHVQGHRQAVLFIDDGNRPALAGCESLGFQRVGRFSFTLWE